LKYFEEENCKIPPQIFHQNISIFCWVWN